MSVLIKGMKMPKNCSDCPLYDDEDSFCKAQNEFLNIIISNNGFLNLIISKRDEAISCPLVELPEHHGRLVDAEYLEKHADEWLSTYNLIDSAETVVEAE